MKWATSVGRRARGRTQFPCAHAQTRLLSAAGDGIAAA
jgi:hypothetical protein